MTEDPAPRFADNLERLMGLHRLKSRDIAERAEVSESVLAKWRVGSRTPSFTSMVKIADFFGIEPGRLARAQFVDLLEHELADAGRFSFVESQVRFEHSLREYVEARKPADALAEDLRAKMERPVGRPNEPQN